MSESRPTIVIDVDVGERPPFKYQGIGENGQFVDGEGNIDLRESELDEHDIEFRLKTMKTKINGVPHDLAFAGQQSISIEEKGKPERELLAALDGRSQFYGYANPDGDPQRLRFSNRNKGGVYKYTLQVKARAQGTGTEDELEHDPLIKNTGAGGLASN